MTEQDWLACNDPMPMLAVTRTGASERKRQLFACACCHRIAPRICHPEKFHRFIHSVEDFADSTTHREQVEEAQFYAWFESGLKWRSGGDPVFVSAGALEALWPTLHLDDVVSGGCEGAGTEAIWRAWELSSQKRSFRLWKREGRLTPKEREDARNDGVAAERGLYCELVREIFGDPFRPVALDPEWRTSTVVALARDIYEKRAFDQMPILADALQDAGCDNADVLDHCRGKSPHVRGCWVVDLILGKS